MFLISEGGTPIGVLVVMPDASSPPGGDEVAGVFVFTFADAV